MFYNARGPEKIDVNAGSLKRQHFPFRKNGRMNGLPWSRDVCFGPISLIITFTLNKNNVSVVWLTSDERKPTT